MIAHAEAAALARRVEGDQVETLYGQWRRTTASMLLGASILTTVMWGAATASTFTLWIAAIVVNQTWRYQLVRSYRAADPPAGERRRWGQAWALGSTVAGALWGIAGAMLYSAGDVAHQALLIVCLFGVVLGGVDLTSVYKPSFYGFVLPALVPLTLRVALQGDQVHVYLASVMIVVLTFILRFGHNLNHLMAQSLAIRYDNVDLIRELKQQTVAADAARAEAESASRSKTRFLAAASHDLRQPLHALALFGAALAVRVREPGAREMVASVNASVEALERLFSALMDISKLDAGAVAPSPGCVALQPLLERLTTQLAPLAASRGICVRYATTRTWTRSDPLLLERILANFLANAMAHTVRGGVLLGVRRRGRELRIDVIDTGSGIAEGEQSRIFDEFYRGSAARDAGMPGMGLGLAIVKRLAALLDHHVELQSIPGRGSRFSLVVPRAQPATDTAAITVETTPASLAGRLIAIVDDEPAVVAGMRACLLSWGASVAASADADGVLAALGSCGRYPDLIIADYHLAGSTGLDEIARLRDELGLAIPAILVSGDASAEGLAAMRAAELPVLVKPVVPGHLRTLAEICLASPAAARGEKKAPPDGGAGGQTEFGMTG
jgi:signal transduction histidine kinase/CheY-like chemotaxis protein